MIGGLGMPELLIFLLLFLPFFINPILAISRGKSIALILLLTLIFSWLVTLILAFIPKVKKTS